VFAAIVINSLFGRQQRQQQSAAHCVTADQKSEVANAAATIMNPNSFDKYVAVIGMLPTLYHEPDFQNWGEIHCALCEQLATIPSSKCPYIGHHGMAKIPRVWVVLDETPWIYETNPGEAPHPFTLPSHGRGTLKHQGSLVSQQRDVEHRTQFVSRRLCCH